MHESENGNGSVRYPEAPSSRDVDSKKSRLFLCVILLVIGGIAFEASTSFCWRVISFIPATIGFYAGIGCLIALRSAKKNYNRARRAYNEECCRVDRENKRSETAKLQRELDACQTRIDNLLLRLAESDEERRSAESFGQLFSQIGGTGVDAVLKNQKVETSQLLQKLEEERERQKSLRRQLDLQRG